MKLKIILDRIRRATPKKNKHGQMYATAAQTKLRYRRIVVHTIFVSDENTHMYRPHVFNKNEHLSPEQWHAWLSEHLTRVHEMGILPGMNIRTGKLWAVAQILGWTGNAQYATKNVPKRSVRHQAKRKRK